MSQNVKSHSLVRPMHVSDVQAVVRVHLLSFQGFFLTFLGPGFLYELYSAIIADSSGIVFVWEQDNQIVGFVAGTDQPSGLYTRLLRQRLWLFCLASIKPALLKPSIIPRLLRALTIQKRLESIQGMGTLMSVAVLPKNQKQGIDKSLIETFLKEAKERGLTKVNLTTDTCDNNAVNHFYKQLGFVCARTFITSEGRQMNEYVIAV